MPLLSIIVPVFNSEAYLNNCIESILGSSISDFELLLIDNGSSDASVSICEKYGNADYRIRLLHEPRGGVGNARNKGIEEARGEYIGFDSDDTIDERMFSLLVEQMQQGMDMAVCGVFVDYECGKSVPQNCSYTSVRLSPQRAQDYALMNSYYRGYLVNKLFRRDIIEHNNLRLNSAIQYCEDLLFVIQYLSCSKSGVYYISEPHYHYRIHSDNTTENYSERMLTGLIALGEIKKIVEDSKTIKVVQSAEAGLSSYILSKMNSTQKNNDAKTVLELKQLIRKNIIPGILSQERSLKSKMMLVLRAL